MRLHLFFIMLLIGMVPLLLTNWILLDTTMNLEVESATLEMQAQALMLANQMSEVNYISAPDNVMVNTAIEQTADIWGGRIQVIDGEFRILRDTYMVDVGKYNISEYVIRCLNGEPSSSFNSNRQFVAFTQPIYRVDSDSSTATITLAAGSEVMQIEGVLLVTVDLQSAISPLIQARKKAFILEAAAFFCLILVILLIVTFCMRPFKRLAKAISRAAEGGLREQVNVRTYAETEQISDSYNRTARRLQLLDESRQQFVSNVSHELKTPITSIRVLADSLMSMGDVPVELYQEFMKDISDEIDRESKIIDDLLSMVRLENKDQKLNIAPVSINEMMELLLKRLSPIARERNIEILFESFRPVTAEIDEVKLNLAITNLVENAIKYNRDSGWVKVSLNADHKYFYIKVTDSGCGIPADELEHIFERFYRVDKARSRETGGTGLGLSITKTVIQLHRGAIKVHSKLQEGTTFVVRIPLKYVKE